MALRQQLQAHSRPFSFLSPRTIPDEGGETQFADMRAGWDALPDRMKARLEGLICEHTQLFSRALIVRGAEPGALSLLRPAGTGL